MRCGTGLFVTDDLLWPGASLVSLVSLAHSLAGLAMKYNRVLTIQTHASGGSFIGRKKTKVVAAVPIVLASPPDSDVLPLQIGALLVGSEHGVLRKELEDTINSLASSLAPAMMTIAFPVISQMTHLLHLRDHDACGIIEEEMQDLPLEVANPLGSFALIKALERDTVQGNGTSHHHSSRQKTRQNIELERKSSCRRENAQVSECMNGNSINEFMAVTQNLGKNNARPDQPLDSSSEGPSNIMRNNVGSSLLQISEISTNQCSEQPCQSGSIAEDSFLLPNNASPQNTTNRSLLEIFMSSFAAPLWCSAIFAWQSSTMFLPFVLLLSLILFFVLIRGIRAQNSALDSALGITLMIGVVSWSFVNWAASRYFYSNDSAQWPLYSASIISILTSSGFYWFLQRDS